MGKKSKFVLVVFKFIFWARDLSDLWIGTRKLLELWNEGEPWNQVLPLTNVYQEFLHSSYNQSKKDKNTSEVFYQFILVEKYFYKYDFPKNR